MASDVLLPDSFYLDGGGTGVLCVHGLSATPSEMLPVAQAIHQHGHTVSGVRVARHGTSIEDFAQSTWSEWVESVDEALHDLKQKTDQVFVVAQSAGVLMSLHALQNHDDIKGLVALAPALFLRTRLLPHSVWWRYLVKQMSFGESDCLSEHGPSKVWAYKTLPTETAYQFHLLVKGARPLMETVDMPLLVAYGKHDKTVHPKAPQSLFDAASHDDKELLWLENSAHMLTVDHEGDEIARRVADWVHQRAVSTAGPTAADRVAAGDI